MSRIRASEAGLSTTTTSSGLFDDARTRPQVPSSTVTRTPLTVTRSRIDWPMTFSPFCFAPSKYFTTSSTTRYFTSSAQCGDMVGDDLVALVVAHAAAVAVAVEAERHVRLVLDHGVAHGVQHLHVFGVGIVVRERVIELAVKRHDLAADRLEHARREGARGAVAAAAYDMNLLP